MPESFIHNLIQPCKNRGIELIDHKDGSVSLDGKRLYRIRDCMEYLESVNRIDF